MTVFTVIGVLWFWMLCFEIGHFIGWASEEGGRLLSIFARVLLGSRETDRIAHAVILDLQRATSRGKGTPE
jgi:hypothetical protein